MTSETACELCQGTKWVEVPGDGITLMKRCACLQREIARARLAAAMIPRRYEHCSLDNLLTYGNPGLKRAVERSRRFIDEFPDVDRSLLLTGPSGIGKTHIAVAILRQLAVEKHVRGFYDNARRLLSTVRLGHDPANGRSEEHVMNTLTDAELLVLDDLGAGWTINGAHEVMAFIIGARHEERLPTIFTSNHQFRAQGRVQEIGNDTYSRLREMCEIRVRWTRLPRIRGHCCPTDFQMKRRLEPSMSGRMIQLAVSRCVGCRAERRWWTHGPPPVNPTTSESRTFGKAPMRTCGAT